MFFFFFFFLEGSYLPVRMNVGWFPSGVYDVAADEKLVDRLLLNGEIVLSRFGVYRILIRSFKYQWRLGRWV